MVNAARILTIAARDASSRTSISHMTDYDVEACADIHTEYFRYSGMNRVIWPSAALSKPCFKVLASEVNARSEDA